MKHDAVIIGGGFFGCRLALHLSEYMDRIILFEKEDSLMQRASFVNQARVHAGYHYPRSILTSLRSRLNCMRFMEEYKECIDTQFSHYYAVSRRHSKLTAGQFRNFCRRIEAPLYKPSAHIRRLFDDDYIEEVFGVTEYAFDAIRLQKALWEQMKAKGIEICHGTRVCRVVALDEGTSSGVRVEYESGDKGGSVECRLVLNCTYSQINQINAASNIPRIPLKHELTEMALIEPPDHLKGVGITVMDGPFFSTMPFPSSELHTLSHVRYTPHESWTDSPATPYRNSHEYISGTELHSRYPFMIKDAQRYVPSLAQAHYVKSLWEIKTVLPRSEEDDSRPILYKRIAELPGYFAVMGAKIDNIYDIQDKLSEELDLEVKANENR